MLKTKGKVLYIGQSDRGLVREKNEDAWAAFPELALFIVADGMGGHAGGEVASQSAVALLQEALTSIGPMEAPIALKEAMRTVNARIYEHGQRDPTLTGMGTTMCVLWLQGEAIYAHVGDSRLYRLRGASLQQLTQDHTLLNELIAMGGIQEAEAEGFPYKHILTKAIGTHPEVEPSSATTTIQTGDLFILCTDGLTNFVGNGEIAAHCQGSTLEQAASELIALAKSRGGSDNITLLLVKVLES